MNDRKEKDRLTEDVDFRFLKQYRPGREEIILQNDLMIKGCMNPLKVWNGYLIDGYRRYDICTRMNIPYRLDPVNDLSRSEVISRICSEQLQRRDISENMRKYLIGKKYMAAVQSRTDPNRQNAVTASYPEEYPLTTVEQLAKELHISTNTVSKYRAFAAAIDSIRSKVPELAYRIMNGGFSRLSHSMALEIASLDTDSCIALLLDINGRNLKGITHYEVRNARMFAESSAAKGNAPASSADNAGVKGGVPGIKRMPKEDPDERIKSLTNTIPYWRDTLRTAYMKSDMDAVSITAIEKLVYQLDSLTTEIKAVRMKIMEVRMNA